MHIVKANTLLTANQKGKRQSTARRGGGEDGRGGLKASDKQGILTARLWNEEESQKQKKGTKREGDRAALSGSFRKKGFRGRPRVAGG